MLVVALSVNAVGAPHTDLSDGGSFADGDGHSWLITQGDCINPNTGYAYVANGGEGSVTVLQGASVITTIGVGNSPRSVGVNPMTGTCM